MKPKVAKFWKGGSAAKTSMLFFGYFSAAEHPQRRETYSLVVERLLSLAQEKAVQILYMDNTIQERRVVVYRFTSEQAYTQFRGGLVKLGEELEKGIWEPHRDAKQYSEWLTELSEATPTVAL
jgi:hypothetical protein